MSKQGTYQLFRKIKKYPAWRMITKGSYDKCIGSLKFYTNSYEPGYEPVIYKIVKEGELDLSKHAGFPFDVEV